MQYFGFDRPSFAFKTYGFGANFDPLTLFAGGKQGVWYDPSDKSTLFQDVAGIVPVTKDGDPVGLILDKSQGLEGAITNVAKPFIADSINDALEVTNTSEGTKLVIKSLTSMSRINIFEVGKTYRLTVVYSISETASDISVYNTSSGASNFLFTATKGVKNKAEVTFTAKNISLFFRTSSGEITIHEVVLKEIKGNHASQPLAASRPTYRTDGILHWLEFDGVDDYLSATYSSFVTQPAILAIAVQITRLPRAAVLVSGVSVVNRHQITAHPNLDGEFTVLSGRAESDRVLSNVLDKSVIVAKLNATSSNLGINNISSPISLDESGTDGFILGGSYVAGYYANMRFYGGVHVSSATDTVELKSYLATKSGVTL